MNWTRDDRGRVGVSWAEVEAELGHPHDGDPEEDRALCRALVREGAPAWVAHASGQTSEWGWWLEPPERTGCIAILRGPTGEDVPDEAIGKWAEIYGLPDDPVWTEEEAEERAEGRPWIWVEMAEDDAEVGRRLRERLAHDES